ncbi:MAG: hypothetical protein HND51_12815 [Chloroflexi bacterium]|nr:hypothetical protein [Chloroflexota bacterium]
MERIKRLSEQGERSTAQKELVAFLRDEPRNVDAWWMLAQVLLDPRKKIEAYRHILNLDPDHMEAARQFAVLTLPPGQPLEASEEYQNALAEYYRKRDEMPPVPEPAEENSPPPTETVEEKKPDTGSPLDNVQRAFPTQQPRNVGELEPLEPEHVEEPIQPAVSETPDAAPEFEELQSADDQDADEAWMHALEPVEEAPVDEGNELRVEQAGAEEDQIVEPGLDVEQASAEVEETIEAPQPEEPQTAGQAAEDVESKPLGEDEYPEDFKEALENMRLQGGLRPEGPKPDVWKAAQAGLRPDMLRTDFVSDALGSTSERRIQDLADSNMDTLQPLDADQRIQCPNCQATIAKDSEKCEWCGEKLHSND